MRGRQAGCRQVAGVDVTTPADGAADPLRTLTIAAAAAALSVAVLLVGGLSPISGADAPRPRADSTSGLTRMTSPDTWWTMNEKHHGTRLSTHIRRSAPLHLRHRHHRHRQRNRQTQISGFEIFRPHSSRTTTDNSTTSGRRSFRHVDDKSTSGSDASILKVVADPQPSANRDPVLVEAETGPSACFRFCDHRLISSAVDPIRCRSSSGDASILCLAELVALDNEAEVKFQQFSDVMALFDCGHAYSVTSRCDECEVRNDLSL